MSQEKHKIHEMKTGLNMSKQRKQRRNIPSPFSPLPPVKRSESLTVSRKKSPETTKRNSLIVHSCASSWQFPSLFSVVNPPSPSSLPSLPSLPSVQLRFVKIRPPSALHLPQNCFGGRV